MPKLPFLSKAPGAISHALHRLVAQLPASREAAADDPTLRSQELAKAAALKAATLSGSFTLPPGPLGLATVVPELLAIWRIQQQLVADIAATFGKTEMLTPETMAICLFRHGGAAVTGRLFSKAGDDIIVQRIANRTLQQLVEKVAVRLTQRLAAKSVSRWVPVLGALGAGAYAYYDTTHVAATSIELFSKQLRLKASAGQVPGARSSRSRRRRIEKPGKAATSAAPPKPKRGRRRIDS